MQGREIENILFDRNRTDFDNAIQKGIWNIGKNLVPLELSLAGLADQEMRDGCTQVYSFITDLLVDMYHNPDVYHLFPIGERYLAGTDIYFWLLHRLCKFCSLKDTQLIVDTLAYNERLRKEKRGRYRYETLERLGLFTHTQGVNTVFTSSKYPLFLKYYYLLHRKSREYQLNSESYVKTCDFRIFTKGFAPTFDDLIRPLSDKDRVLAMDLHNYAVGNNVKPAKCKYVQRVNYKYRGINVLDIEVGSGLLEFTIRPFHTGTLRCSTGENIDRLNVLLARAESCVNANELMDFILKHIRYCTCWCGRTAETRCGMWYDLFGKRRMLCIGTHIMTRTADEPDIRLLKQLLDFKIQRINEEKANSKT